MQFLLLQHYEFNQLLHRYVLISDKRFPPLPELYKAAVKEGSISANGTFTMGFVTNVFRGFISDYYSAIETSFHVVTELECVYWARHHPYILMHLDMYPPLFLNHDWFARYYYDEYENETQHISLKFFADLDEATYNALSPR